MITLATFSALISFLFSLFFFIHNIFFFKTFLVDVLALLNVNLDDSWNFVLEGTWETLDNGDKDPVNIEDLHISHYIRKVEAVECAVCILEIEDGHEIRELRCEHLFHRVCLEQWAGYGHGTCPMCRDLLAPWKTTANVEGMLGVKPQFLPLTSPNT